MPIRAEERHRYPENWPDISAAIKWERAGGRCECTGECGRRDGHLDPLDGRCRNRHGEPRWGGAVGQCAVVLTTAHLDHQPENCDPENLRAWCEGCHLRYDQAHHAATRRESRMALLGMDPLF
jgi:hypothetical protein